MKRKQLWIVMVAGALAVSGPSLAAQVGQPRTIQERARGAARVVVATVVETSARRERNEFGDDLIITRAQLSVDEAVKGPGGPTTLTLEGGTVDGITMRVSDLPSLKKGERAVFFLAPGRDGEFQPHLRGQGILKLDKDNRVPDSSLTLAEIRRLAAGGK
jgi:hypothetical protein